MARGVTCAIPVGLRELCEELAEGRRGETRRPDPVVAALLADALDQAFPVLSAAWGSLTKRQKRAIRQRADVLLPPELQRGGSERELGWSALELRVAFWLTMASDVRRDR